MVLETIIIGFVALLVTLIVSVGGVIGISSYKGIALGLAEISETGKNTRERINARADYEPYGEGDDGEAEGGMSEMDGIARLAGYSSAAAALSDPKLISKVGSILGKKE